MWPPGSERRPGLRVATAEDRAHGRTDLRSLWEKRRRPYRKVYSLRRNIGLVDQISGKFTRTAPLGGGKEQSTAACMFKSGKLSSHPSALNVRSTRRNWTIYE